MVAPLVAAGVDLHAPDATTTTPVLAVLRDLSSSLTDRDSVGISSRRAASTRLLSLIESGWDPDLEPNLRAIRLLAGRMAARVQRDPSGENSPQALVCLRAALRRHRLGLRVAPSARPLRAPRL